MSQRTDSTLAPPAAGIMRLEQLFHLMAEFRAQAPKIDLKKKYEHFTQNVFRVMHKKHISGIF